MQGQLPALSQGVEQLSQGAKDLKQGTGSLKTGAPVSYTHLDVYKRQIRQRAFGT